MSKKSSKFVLIVLITVISMVVIYVYQRAEVEILDIEKDCSKAPCEISFLAVNKTNHYISCNISLRGLKGAGSKNVAATNNGFAGEKTINIELYPKERKQIKETLMLKGRAYKIQVNPWKIIKIKP